MYEDFLVFFEGRDGSKIMAAPSASRHAGVRVVVDQNGAVDSAHIQGADGFWRLHSVDGNPSTRIDGKKVWHLHGVQVPQWLARLARLPAEKRAASIERVLALKSAEARRVGLQLMPPSALSGLVDSTLDVAQRSDGGIEAVVRLRDGSHWLVADDGSTGRVYWLPLTVDIASVATAQAALYGVDAATMGDRS